MAKEPSADYRTILTTAAGGKFTDDSFPMQDSLYWPDRPNNNTASLIQGRVTSITSWKRLSDKY
jgi:hypothetical protein